MFRHVYIISDIEGSSGCFDYDSSRFLTPGWPAACDGMTRDVDVVARALFDAGVQKVTVKDFHRTGYNIFPEQVDKRARIISGYKKGPVPGFGSPGDADGLMFIGMHAASGSNGFLAHTFTSRIAKLEVNGKPVSELELFASILHPFGLRPLFFSGGPVACRQAREVMPCLSTWEIDKSHGQGGIDIQEWREGLARAAVESLESSGCEPYLLPGPYATVLHMRDGEEEAKKLADRWGLTWQENRVYIHTADFSYLWLMLIQVCFLTPAINAILPLGLFLYNTFSRAGLFYARHKL